MQVKLNGEPTFLCAPRGRHREPPASISFEMLAMLAGADDRIPTVTYSTRGDRSGTLAPGERTNLEEGMSFNVIVTDGA